MFRLVSLGDLGCALPRREVVKLSARQRYRFAVGVHVCLRLIPHMATAAQRIHVGARLGFVIAAVGIVANQALARLKRSVLDAILGRFVTPGAQVTARCQQRDLGLAIP